MAAEGKLEVLATIKDKASGALRKIKGLAGGIGGALKKGALIGGAAIVGLGVLAFKFGNDFKEAFNTIAVGTGATGDELAALEEDFKATFAKVPADMKDVAQATADLNTRLGLTGEPLQRLTQQFLEFSRITDTDVGANIQTVTRLFGDWSVATDDQELSLDRLFKTSQATGIEVDKLSSLVVQFGAPLRGFGFTLDQSTALLAKFEKEGVNTEAVMAGLKIGLGKLAAAGKDPVTEFAKVSDAIAQAGSIGEANAAAIELFGTRAGPDMAAAIREGRFEIDDFIAQMDAGGAGILETAEATETWKEKLLKLRNKALVKLEPVLTGFVDLVGRVADFLGDKIPIAIDGFVAGFKEADVTSAGFFGTMERVGKGVREFLDDAIPIVEEFADKFVLGLETIKPLAEDVFNFIISNKPALVAAITAIGVAILLALGPGAIAVAAIIGLIVLIGLIRENFGEWKATVEDFVDSVVAKIEGIPVIGEIFEATVQVIDDKIEALKGIIQGLIDFVEEFVEFVSAIFRGDWAAAWDALKNLAVIALNLFLDFLQVSFFGTIKSILQSIVPWDWIGGAFTAVKDNMIGAFEDAKEGVLTALRAIRDTGSLILEGLKGGFKGALNAIITTIERGINFMLRGIANGIALAKRLADAVPGPNPFGNAMQAAIDALRSGVSLPRLEHGGRVLKTGVAVVHEGEEFTRGGSRAAQVFERGAFEGAQFVTPDPDALFKQLRRLGTA